MADRHTLTETIQRLPLELGKCGVAGCGEDLLCVVLEHWSGKGPIPPPRFACPAHDVWLGSCFDGGDPSNKLYPHGLYHATMRHPDDPAWGWLPEALRPAAIEAGFAVDRPEAYPGFYVGVHRGRTWATDRRTLVAIGDEWWLRSVQLNLGKDLDHHRLTAAQIASMTDTMGNCWTVQTVGRPSDAGRKAERWDASCVAFGLSIVPARTRKMLEAFHPGAEWLAAAGNPLAPVYMREPWSGDVVAVVMPINCDEHERRERGEVCPAKHQGCNGAVTLNYSCTLPPDHDGIIHEMRDLGGSVYLRWSEADYPRTDR